MARLNNRRSRAPESEEEDYTRESTPLSTAPSDRKRMRPDVEASSSPVLDVQIRSKEAVNTLTEQNGHAASTRRKHQPGAIVRVKLTNFVTYTSAEFFPGPNLNMVIGPNGTGKSTLVCAICLGLGWGPALLGRASAPAEFVKHGCKEATIEIELQRAERGMNKSNNNPVITRKIRKDDNQSKFWINGNTATVKAVRELMDGFNIQVDNLCQFLPQDRVVEFAQMTPVEMLETTLKAAADPEVLKVHARLKDLRSEQQNFMYNSKGDRNLLENLQRRQEAQKLEVERLRERQSVQKQIANLEKCKPVAKYTQIKKRAAELRRTREELTIETRRLEEEAEPTLRRVNAKRDYAAAAENYRDENHREVKRAEGECKRIDREIVAADEAIKECERRVVAERDAAKKDKSNLMTYQKNLRSLQARKEEPPEPFDSRAINEEIQQHTREARELVQKIEAHQNEINSLCEVGQNHKNRKNALENSIKALDTQQGQQEARLAQASKDAAQAWRWIKENQSRFKKEVFGPPAVTCTVKNPHMASAVESVLQNNDFKIITVQCREDFSLLQQELVTKQRLHDISLRTCALQDLSTLKKPMNEEQLQNLGLQHWAIDCLEGPSTVLAMLCQEKFLHQIGISLQEVTSEQHERISESPIKSYVAGTKSVRFTRRAEYGDAGVSARTSELHTAKFWTNQPVDADQRRRLENEIRQVSRDIHEAKESIEKLKVEGQEFEKQRQEHQDQADKLKAEKDVKQRIQTEFNGLDVKIDQTRRRIDACETNIANFRERLQQILAERDEAILQKADSVLRYCEAAHTFRNVSARLLEAEMVVIEAQSDFESLQQLNKDIRETLEAKQRALVKAREDFAEIKKEGEALAIRIKALSAEADKLSGEGDNGLRELLEEFTKQPDVTEESIIDKIDSLKSQLEFLAGGLADASTLRDFEERAKKIDKLASSVARVDKDLDEYRKAISIARAQFEKDLQPIITQIDRAFGESFARIGCAGQVAVYKASSDDPADCTEAHGGQENGLDFANWAIHISVKFRESEPLSLLDSHRQSGGERAVSTIFYLMALQSLSRSPFRVVDEINQGMDPRNERMVHGRMVDIACENERLVAEGKTLGSQYFLITPKLLSGLKYERGMTVLCIVSGENVPSATDHNTRDNEGREYVEKGRKVDFGLFARRARELRAGRNAAAATRVDSGIGMRNVGVYG